MPPDLLADLARVANFHATGTPAEVDALLAHLHLEYHQRPIDHVRVHVTWMRVQFARKAYLRGLFHAFAGLVVAGPASLVHRYTGLVAPAFAEKP